MSPRESPDRPLQVPRAANTPLGNTSSGSVGPDRLDGDEWQFLRATPDYDAEEMAGVGLPLSAFAPPDGIRVLEAPSAPLLATGEFPEAGSLVEMLGELLETPSAAPRVDSEAAWSEVPAAEEWADLMAAEASEPPAPPEPEQRDVLLEALAGFEQVGRFPNVSSIKR